MMKLTVILLAFLQLAFAEEQVTYDGFKVYRVTPKTEADAKVIQDLRANDSYDFWSEPRFLNTPVTVMVAPEVQTTFENYMKLNNLEISIHIDNVARTVEKENLLQKSATAVPYGSVSFTQYMRHNEINNYLEHLARTYPSIARLENLGQSYEGRSLLALRISSGGRNKPTIFIDAGIHAREWIAPPAALYIIHQLVENRENAVLYRNVDWVVLPVLNPDGYEYTHTNARFWRKTRSPGVSCRGVDGNRNFDFHWMEIGASSSQCSDTFAGPRAFSERETTALRDYLLAHRSQIKLYLTFHSYGNYILYPWGYTNALPSDNAELLSLGQSVGTAIRNVAGTRYTVGSSTNVLYAAAGGSDDFAKGRAGIQLAYTLELPAGGNNGFNPPASRILPIVRETWEGIKVYERYIDRKFNVNN